MIHPRNHLAIQCPIECAVVIPLVVLEWLEPDEVGLTNPPWILMMARWESLSTKSWLVNFCVLFVDFRKT